MIQADGQLQTTYLLTFPGLHFIYYCYPASNKHFTSLKCLRKFHQVACMMLSDPAMLAKAVTTPLICQ